MWIQESKTVTRQLKMCISEWVILIRKAVGVSIGGSGLQTCGRGSKRSIESAWIETCRGTFTGSHKVERMARTGVAEMRGKIRSTAMAEKEAKIWRIIDMDMEIKVEIGVTMKQKIFKEWWGIKGQVWWGGWKGKNSSEVSVTAAGRQKWSGLTQASKLRSSKEQQEHSESENEHQKEHLIKLEAQSSKGGRTAITWEGYRAISPPREELDFNQARRLREHHYTEDGIPRSEVFAF